MKHVVCETGSARVLICFLFYPHLVSSNTWGGGRNKIPSTPHHKMGAACSASVAKSGSIVPSEAKLAASKRTYAATQDECDDPKAKLVPSEKTKVSTLVESED